MMKKCRFTAVILSFIIAIISMNAVVFAKTTFDDVVFDLQTLGIMTGDENGDMQLDRPVTRAEFAAITVRLMSMSDAAKWNKSNALFDDVKSDYWASDAIYFLTNMKIINGIDEKTFNPEGTIDINAACKILVSALGYDVYAQNAGGYPNGYLSQAQSLKLLDGVDVSSSQMTRKDIARMTYNALDVDIMIMEISNGISSYVIDEGNTFRNKFTAGADGKLTKLTGIVTATADAYLNEPVPGMEENSVEINDKIYFISNAEYNKFFGRKVDFFVESEDSNVIVSMRLSSDTSETTIEVNSVDSVSSGKITYYNDDGVKKSIRYDKNGYYLYNNRISYDFDAASLMNMKNGIITLIDNDDDGVADVIMAKEFKSFVVKSVSPDIYTMYLTDGQSYCGKSFIKADPDDSKRVTLSNSDGDILSVSDIKENDVLTCVISSDEQMTEIFVSSSMITGVVTGISDESVTVDGNAYLFETEGQDFGAEVARKYDIYLNFRGEVAYIKKSGASEDYAYVEKVYLDDDEQTYFAKLVLPDVMQEKKEQQKDDDGGASSTVVTLACQNSSIIHVKLANKVSVNGDKYSAKAAATILNKSVFKYKTNSNGELITADSPQQIGTGRSKYYNSKERTFGKTTGGAFGIDENTKTVCIPLNNNSPSNEDLLTAVEMNNGQLYDVTAYDIYENTHMAGLIAVTMTMKSGTAGIITTSSKIGMVQSVRKTFVDGEEYCGIDVLTEDNKLATYKITDAAENSPEFRTPSAGDLISYSLDIDYNIDAVKILGEMAGATAYGRINPREDYETFCGKISDIEMNCVSESLNRWVHIIKCYAPADNGNEEAEYEVLKFKGPPIYIYNTRTKESTVGTVNDIDIAGDDIFVSAANSSVRAVVVLR